MKRENHKVANIERNRPTRTSILETRKRSDTKTNRRVAIRKSERLRKETVMIIRKKQTSRRLKAKKRSNKTRQRNMKTNKKKKQNRDEQ